MTDWIPDCDSHSPSHALLDLCLSCDASILQLISLHCEILIMLLSQFPLTFCQTQNGMPHFIVFTVFDYLKDGPWEDIFKLGVSAAASEFCEGSG